MSKETATSRIWLLSILTAIGMFWLVSGTIDSLPKNMKRESYTSLEESEDYYIGDLIVLGKTSDWGGKYLVSFIDKDGQRVYTEISVENGSEFDKKCEAYVEGECYKSGNEFLSGCFCLRGAIFWDSFSLWEYTDIGIMYQRFNAEFPGELLDRSFEYEGSETVKEYFAQEVDLYIETMRLGAIFVLCGGIGNIILIHKRKNLPSEEEISKTRKALLDKVTQKAIDYRNKKSADSMISQIKKDELYKKINDFQFGKYLQEMCSDDEGVIYYFMKRYFVAFLYALSEEQPPIGILLAPIEVELFLQGGFSQVFEVLVWGEDKVIVFTDEMVSLGKSFAGRLKIRRMMKSRCLY